MTHRVPHAPAQLLPLRGHSPALDGLRAIAILIVILGHSTAGGGLGSSPLYGDRTFHEIMTSGWVGVDLFFVLSGYLITSILMDARGSAHAVSRFYMRRILRIFPLFYGYLFLIHVVLPPVGVNMLDVRIGYWPWHFFFATNFATALHGWQPRGVGHFWTLSLEEQYYFVWPWVVLFLRPRWAMSVCAAMLLSSSLGRLYLELRGKVNPTLYTLPFFRWDGLACGSLVALSIKSGVGPAFLRSRLFWRGVLFLSALALPALRVPGAGFHEWTGLRATFGFLLLSLFFTACVALCVGREEHSAVARWLASRPMRAIGRVSYGAYVFHMPVIHFLSADKGLYKSIPPFPGESRILPYTICALATIGATLALAAVSWYFFEGPINARKARWDYRGQPAPQ